MNTNKETKKPVVRLHLWLETPEGLVFGVGRALLLKKVEEHGSLRKAAKELGMSYRAAWGKIKKTEEIIGDRLVVQSGSRRGGYELTELGRRLLEGFESWYSEIESYAISRAPEFLPWEVGRFDSKLQKD